MKKIKLSMLGLLLSASAFAQVYTDPGNGNVGIGTTSPVAKLDIFAADNTAATSLFSLRSNFHVVGNYGMIRFGDYTQTTQYQKGAIIYESVWGSARGKFHIAMENTDGPGSVSLIDSRLTVESNGNVGIGVTTPTDKLQVEGNQFSLRNSGTNNGLIFNVNAFGHPAIIPTNGNGTVDKHLVIAPYGGNLLIGKTNQANTAYKVDINGKVRANEMVVNTTGADFVFESGYPLRSIADLEKFVKQNRHLPEIPSAKTMQQEGVGISELQTRLLQKVEELTLYIIQQQKEIDELKKKVKQ